MGAKHLRLALLGMLAALGGPRRASADPPPTCNEQPAQAFLMRQSYAYRSDATFEERQKRRQAHQRAIRYRTEQYGWVLGFGRPEWNPLRAADYAEKTSFFGIPLALNRRVVPALRCVEHAIRTSCGGSYVPETISGLRRDNTFYNGEASNHLYGIAVDIDPEHNFCCGCLGPAGDHPICKRYASVFETMAMPACWVTSFERFGFHWLGRDELEDTMHFEFLGDPDRILASEP